MVDDDNERPSLEAPRLFGRRKTAATPAFEDSGTDVTADSGPHGAPATADTTAAVPSVTPSPRRRGLRLGLATRAASDRDTDDGSPGQVDLVDPPAATDDAPRPRSAWRDRTTVSLAGREAAAVTGVLAGLSLIAFTWLGFRGCEALSGTTSCGRGPGMLALVAVMVLTIVVGALLLSRFTIADPGATSFLGTGLTGVIYLLVLVNRLEGWPTLVVIPLISAVTYVAAWWVTTTYVDTD